MKCISVVNKNFEKIFWGLVGWLVLYVCAWAVALAIGLVIPAQIGLFITLILLFFLPALCLSGLSLYALWQVLGRAWRLGQALQYLALAILVDLLFIVFFFFALFSVYGFS